MLLNRIRRVQKIRDVSSIANVHFQPSKADVKTGNIL